MPGETKTSDLKNKYWQGYTSTQTPKKLHFQTFCENITSTSLDFQRKGATLLLQVLILGSEPTPTDKNLTFTQAAREKSAQ